MSKNDPAFPYIVQNVNERGPGLTKRELIAAMLMQGLMSNSSVVVVHPVSGTILEHDELELYAKNKADALLAELSKEAE